MGEHTPIARPMTHSDTIAAACACIVSGKPLAECLADEVARPAFADKLPPRPTHPLRALILDAAGASECVSKGYQACLNEHDMDRLESQRQAAEYALRDFMLTEFGLTTADLSRWPL